MELVSMEHDGLNGLGGLLDQSGGNNVDGC